MKHFLEVFAACTAFVSACFWLGACFARAKYRSKVIDGWEEAAIIQDGYDFLETAKKQTAWNAGAAFSAAIAALAQAASAFISN